ncbi:hypothetical protein RJ639_033014 [Escallonia herrerae]|uniref:MADS-box domain-containing protein n=1 Tax=Escallonia herrerae TaxID=1293975 RepID=A0AA88WX65_9ASTE|nr:hypothetical protein RJ639_033014 [Escallonia herrerae]
MGRKKLQMKRIDDKSSRQVAVVVLSSRGKLYESCAGADRSVFLGFRFGPKLFMGIKMEFNDAIPTPNRFHHAT